MLETYSFKFSYRIDAYTVTYTTLDSSVYLSFVTFDLQPVFAGDELGAHYTPYNYFQLTAPSEVENSRDGPHACSRAENNKTPGQTETQVLC